MALPVSKLDVINQALIELGRLPVANENDNQDSILISAKIDILLPVLILSAPWNFAVKYVTDNTPTTTPFSPEYLYAYQLPADFGRFFRFLTNYFPLSYQFADGLLLTSQRPIQYYYTVNTVDFDVFSTLFYRALALYAASDTCLALTQNETLTQYIAAKFLDAKSGAILFNDMERQIFAAPNDFDRLVYI